MNYLITSLVLNGTSHKAHPKPEINRQNDKQVVKRKINRKENDFMY